MALPINVQDLITGKTVEYVRIEFKTGWNPEDVAHNICAFANDINDYGGGYIIIGIETIDGVPVLPPKGLQQNQLDPIQKEFIEICNKIKPKIFPIIEPVDLQGKHIIVIWVTTGEERPYSAPSTLGPKAQYKIYVRQGSATVVASDAVEGQLRELAAVRHFDDRMHLTASLNELNLGIIRSYLQEIKSELFADASNITMEDLCLKMQLARGPRENVRPLNVALLLFSKEPEKYFPGCVTNLVELNDEAGTSFVSKKFTGPIQTQIRQIMDYLKTSVITELTTKDPQNAEARSFFNYPYQALEEVVANAFHHRGYDNPTPNEIRIYKHGTDAAGADSRRIEILSYPGAPPPVDDEALSRLEVQARTYRNIRLGDFLKHLRLVEKFATGFPRMRRALKDNGSPDPLLSMDKDKTIFQVVIRIHPDTPEDNVEAGEAEPLQLTDLHQRIVESLFNEPGTEEELSQRFQKDVSRDIVFLMEQGMLSSKTITSGIVFRKKSVIYYATPKGAAALKRSF